MADSRAAVNQLRQSFGNQLVQSLNLTNETFSGLQDNLQNFVAQRVPLIGGAVVRISDGLRQVSGDSSKTDKALANVARSVQSIATQSGKSVPQITAFLAKYSQLEGQSK
ncbi:MAG TPA: hypothetical protein VFT02_15045, partial [Pyrinomonadaceae bacterium]|nr:hypothetical protein [Pyrinomonadaceae bacterium]